MSNKISFTFISDSSSTHSELNRLRAENQSLVEELAQTQVRMFKLFFSVFRELQKRPPYPDLNFHILTFYSQIRNLCGHYGKGYKQHHQTLLKL